MDKPRVFLGRTRGGNTYWICEFGGHLYPTIIWDTAMLIALNPTLRAVCNWATGEIERVNPR